MARAVCVGQKERRELPGDPVAFAAVLGRAVPRNAQTTRAGFPLEFARLAVAI